MARVPKTPEELASHREEQLQFLQHSANAFDAGSEGEAKRLATTIRVLCHDTSQSHSLLGLLGIKETTSYIDTSFPYDPNNQLPHSGLVQVAMRKDRNEPRPLLDGGPFARPVDFEAWWNGIAFVDGRKAQFSRRDLVLTLANQEGGAHVDPALDEEYARLSKDNSLGWYEVHPPAKPVPSANQVPAAVRQIAHELIKSLVPGYTKQPLKKADDEIFVMNPSVVRGSGPPPIPSSNPVKQTTMPRVSAPKVGRNKPCPCGSGKKFKKCCGR